MKYRPDVAILNGDQGMHATNECNHRASGRGDDKIDPGVRITASIFASELRQDSLEEVAGHDHYYFPFGNQDWIWAQRGRHWNRDGTASLAEDRGRMPFEAVDAMDDCEVRVGPKKEKCVQNTDERKLCFKTCGMFMTEDEYHPGERRAEVLGW